MTLVMLRDDALRSTPDGFELRLSLPWIRSLPAESLRSLSVRIDGYERDVEVHIPGRWWYLQDRARLRVVGRLAPGAHDIEVQFTLAVPYLAAGPDAPLLLPFRVSRRLDLGPDVDDPAGSHPGPIAADPGTRARSAYPEIREETSLPDGWSLTASAFNWTPDVVRAVRPAEEIALVPVLAGIADAVEIEAGQVWRTFPDPSTDEVGRLRERLAGAGGRVSIVGASIDDWAPDGRRRSDEERAAFLVPQLRAAARVGALGARVPLGQVGEPVRRMLLPTLHDLGVVLFEEAQGHQTPRSHARAYDEIAALDDPHVRVLLDISMLMPALPVTYLDRLHRAGISANALHLLETAWQDPTTSAAVMDLLRSGGVPAPVHTLFMNLVVRFGRSDIAEVAEILPLVGAVHLKFWDLDDADGRLTRPLRDIGRALSASGFAGTLCSEWGGHEWLDDDPELMTRAHLDLARPLLAAR